jgi:cytochrome c oxidase subunit I
MIATLWSLLPTILPSILVVTLVAFYFWMGKITGYHYQEKWGLIHFFTFTVAINIVFLPMHGLGMAGMPRRIPDYPDSFLSLNSFMTIGSFLTFISLFIFLLTIHNPHPTNNNKAGFIE